MIPSQNGDPEYNFIDLYDASDGDYIETLSIGYSPRKLAIDQNYLYILAREGDDYYLLRYQNPLTR